MQTIITIGFLVLQSGVIIWLLKKYITGLKIEITALTKTLDITKQTVEAANQRADEAYKLAELYKQFIEDMPKVAENYKQLYEGIIEAKNKVIKELSVSNDTIIKAELESQMLMLTRLEETVKTIPVINAQLDKISSQNDVYKRIISNPNSLAYLAGYMSKVSEFQSKSPPSKFSDLYNKIMSDMKK